MPSPALPNIGRQSRECLPHRNEWHATHYAVVSPCLTVPCHAQPGIAGQGLTKWRLRTPLHPRWKMQQAVYSPCIAKPCLAEHNLDQPGQTIDDYRHRKADSLNRQTAVNSPCFCRAMRCRALIFQGHAVPYSTNSNFILCRLRNEPFALGLTCHLLQEAQPRECVRVLARFLMRQGAAVNEAQPPPHLA